MRLKAPASVFIFYRVDTAVGEDGKVLSKTYFRDRDFFEEVGFVISIQERGEGSENSIICMSIGPELGYRLSDQHVEPVQTFWLVRMDIVVCFREQCGRCENRWRTDYM